MAQCFAAYGAYGAAEKIALMDEQELAPLKAAQVFHANLRDIGNKGSFFREQFVTGFVLGSGIAGKACMQGCPLIRCCRRRVLRLDAPDFVGSDEALEARGTLCFARRGAATADDIVLLRPQIHTDTNGYAPDAPSAPAVPAGPAGLVAPGVLCKCGDPRARRTGRRTPGRWPK